MNILQNIPSEIVRIILEYDGKIVYRTGKYIDRIPNNDNRYRLLKKIPRPIFVCMDRKIPLVILKIKKSMESYFTIIKKPIDKRLYHDNGSLNGMNNQNYINEPNAILYMFEKYINSYEKACEVRRIFI